MNWRKLVLTGVLATGLSLSLVAPAAADPPPWAGVWRNKHADRDRHGDRDWRERHRDWHRRNGDDYRNGRDYRRGGYDARCGQIAERIRHDRNKINEIAPTGRHKKALQWYKDDLQNARRDMANCRNQASYEPSRSYDDDYGRYEGNDRYYDPYGSANGSFDFERDWPLLLGGFLNQ